MDTPTRRTCIMPSSSVIHSVTALCSPSTMTSKLDPFSLGTICWHDSGKYIWKRLPLSIQQFHYCTAHDVELLVAPIHACQDLSFNDQTARQPMIVALRQLGIAGELWMYSYNFVRTLEIRTHVALLWAVMNAFQSSGVSFIQKWPHQDRPKMVNTKHKVHLVP